MNNKEENSVKFKAKSLFGLMIILCLIMCVSCVSAHDVVSNETDIMTLNSPGTVDINDINDAGSAKELDLDIHSLSPGDTYNFEKDFYLNDTNNTARFYTGIVIETDNVTLNGNGHIIQGNHAAIFSVLASNVKIFNLTICNTDTTRYASDNLYSDFYMISPITWKGNNGLISGCYFYDNCAVNGGAIRLSGNNTIIDNCLFMNNWATAVAGAIYILGTNNTIRNSYFENSSSNLKNSIYINPGISNGSIDNITIQTEDRDGFIMFGDYTCIDAEWFYEPVYDNVFDKNINLYEMLFNSMATTTYIFNNIWTNEIKYLDKNFKYNVESNGTDFYINFNKLYQGFDYKYRDLKQPNTFNPVSVQGDLILSKGYHLNNITSMGDVFRAIHEGNYIIENSLVAEYTLEEIWSDISDIKQISYATLKNYVNALGYVNIENYKGASFLNIILPPYGPSYTTNGLGTIFDHLSDYASIVVNGNGAEIIGPKKNDEDNQWTGIKISKEQTNLVLQNLTITGFNHGIFIDKGICTLINVKITDNSCDYSTEHDWGGGILNLGSCQIVNCTFINNHAKFGAAIFNAGYLLIDNMTQFSGNRAYSTGNEITYVDNAIIDFNGKRYVNRAVDLEFCNGTYFADYEHGYSPEQITEIMWGTFSAAFVGGFFAGVFGGIWIGIGIGAACGLIAGGISTACVLSNNYNYHVSNVNTALIIVGGSVAAGMVGGLIGGLVHNLFSSKPTTEPIDFGSMDEGETPNPYGYDGPTTQNPPQATTETPIGPATAETPGGATPEGPTRVSEIPLDHGLDVNIRIKPII